MRHLGKVVWGKLHQGFKSLTLRMNFIINTKSINESNLKRYSKFKFGSKNEIAYFSNKLIKTIESNHGRNFDDYVLYTPTRKSKCYVNSNNVLCDLISKKINIRKINGFYDRVNESKNTYDKKQSIKLRKKSFSLPNIRPKDISNYQNKKVIIVDDSHVTGVSLKYFLEDVKKLNPKNIFIYFIIDFTKIKHTTEEDLNNFHFKSLKILINYLNNYDYFITTTLIRRLYKEKDCIDFLDTEIKEAFKEYYL